MNCVEKKRKETKRKEKLYYNETETETYFISAV
jgi:hypothetical protein